MNRFDCNYIIFGSVYSILSDLTCPKMKLDKNSYPISTQPKSRA